MKRLTILTICFLAFALTAFSQGNNWRQMPGAAMDIAAGADGSVWIVGTDQQTGGYGIYKWNGSDWSRVDGAATKIAVDRSGNTWVINSSGEIYQRRSNSWTRMPGAATEITAGADGSVWIIGNDLQNGSNVYKWNGRDWSRVNGAAARRIAVDRSGNAWIVDANGTISQRRGNSWRQMSGAATDIGAGADGSIWSVGTDQKTSGYGIYKWENNNWRQTDGAARRVAIDRNGNPWVINDRQEIYQGNSNPNSGGNDNGGGLGTWRRLPGAATDISAGADGSVWITGTDRQTGGFGIYKWNGSDWQQTDGAARRVAVDRRGNPWVINSEREIYQRVNNVWNKMPGTATDISAGADGSIWIIGTDRQTGGYGIYKWRSNNWSRVNNNGGERVAVDRSGDAWIITSDNAVYRQRGKSWDRMPGAAKDISIGSNGTIWIIGTDTQGDGFGIYKWNGKDWSRVEGAARRIAVDNNGNPFVINTKGEIYTQ